MKRKISALLAADIVKYSRLVADAEEETVHRRADYRAVFEEVTARHGGRIVNMVGDAVLADFGSSVDAVRCALDVQAAIGGPTRATGACSCASASRSPTSWTRKASCSATASTSRHASKAWRRPAASACR